MIISAERQRDRETERQRDRETERQRDRETKRQRDRETEKETMMKFYLGEGWGRGSNVLNSVKTRLFVTLRYTYKCFNTCEISATMNDVRGILKKRFVAFFVVGFMLSRNRISKDMK